MNTNNELDILAISLSTLFGAYGKEEQIERLKIYYRALIDLDPTMVQNACKKCLFNCTFLPTIAEIIKEVKDLETEAHPENKIKSWDEAILEISNAVSNASSTKTIEWSTPEIAQAVRMYGFSNLCYASENSYSYGIEMIRKNYIAICSRTQNDIQNKGILGTTGGNILGIPLRPLEESTKSNSYTLISDLISDSLTEKKGDRK